jgi:cytochrome oxidase assembly protein ShyY1
VPRWLLTPRWLGLFALLLVVGASCWWLGRWQWDQARSEVVRSPPPGVVTLTGVHAVGEPVQTGDAGRLVRVAGTFDADRQAVVVDRENDGQQGSWVVTALRIRVGDEEAGADAALIPVVRGWLPEGYAMPEPPTGRQQVTGALEPSESDGLRVRSRDPLPTGQLEIISSAELLSLWEPPLYQGFVIQQRPLPTPPLEVVAPPSRVSVVTDWQNAAYAIQWWLFGLFAIFWFGRMVRMESEDRAAALDTMGEVDATSAGEVGKDSE